MTFESFAPCFNGPDETRPFRTAVIRLPLSCSAAHCERSSGEFRSKFLAKEVILKSFTNYSIEWFVVEKKTYWSRCSFPFSSIRAQGAKPGKEPYSEAFLIGMSSESG